MYSATTFESLQKQIDALESAAESVAEATLQELQERVEIFETITGLQAQIIANGTVIEREQSKVKVLEEELKRMNARLLSETCAGKEDATSTSYAGKEDATSTSSATSITPPQRRRSERNRARALVFQQNVGFGKFKHFSYGRASKHLHHPRHCAYVKWLFKMLPRSKFTLFLSTQGFPKEFPRTETKK